MAATNSTTDVIVVDNNRKGSMMRMYKSGEWKKQDDDDEDEPEPMFAYEKDDPAYKPNDDESEDDSDYEEDEKLRSTRTTKKSDKKMKASRPPLPPSTRLSILRKCNQYNNSIPSEKRNEMMSTIVELPDPSVVSADDLPPDLQKKLAKSRSEQGLLAQGIPPTNWFEGDSERERKMKRGLYMFEKQTKNAGRFEIKSIQAGTFGCLFCPAIIKAMQKNNTVMSTTYLLVHDEKCQRGKTHKERGEDACAICGEAWSILCPQVKQNVNNDRATHARGCLSEADFNSTISTIRTLFQLVPDLSEKVAKGSVGINKRAYKMASLTIWNQSSGLNLPVSPPQGEPLTSDYLTYYSVPSNLVNLYDFAKRSTGRDKLCAPLAGRRAITLQELFPRNEHFPYDREKYSSSKSKKSSSKRSNSAIQSTTSTSSTMMSNISSDSSTTRGGRSTRNSSGRNTRRGTSSRSSNATTNAVPTKRSKIDDEETAKLMGQCMECARECIREERPLERCQWCKSLVCEECILEYDCLHCPHWGTSLSDPTPPHPNPNPYVHGLY